MYSWQAAAARWTLLRARCVLHMNIQLRRRQLQHGYEDCSGRPVSLSARWTRTPTSYRPVIQQKRQCVDSRLRPRVDADLWWVIYRLQRPPSLSISMLDLHTSFLPSSHTTNHIMSRQQSGFKWDKRWWGFGIKMASAGPHANNLHLTPNR